MTKPKTYRSLAEAAADKPNFATREQLDAAFGGDVGDYTDREYGVAPRGRPRAGEVREGTVTKSIRHTQAFWDQLEVAAKANGMSGHQAMRQALAEWLATHSAPRRTTTKKVRVRSGRSMSVAAPATKSTRPRAAREATRARA